jgi:hypothetical protein
MAAIHAIHATNEARVVESIAMISIIRLPQHHAKKAKLRLIKAATAAVMNGSSHSALEIQYMRQQLTERLENQ